MTGAEDRDRAKMFDELTHWWRIQGELGGKRFDKPDWEDGRLYFRSGYQEGLQHSSHWRERGDWLAYVIDPTRDYYDVYVTRLPERSAHRIASLEATFTRADDAVKFITVCTGDSLLVRAGKETLFVRWDAQELDERLQRLQPIEAEIERKAALEPKIHPDFIRQHLLKVCLRSEPGVCAWTLPENGAYMNVLPRSFEEIINEFFGELTDQ